MEVIKKGSSRPGWSAELVCTGAGNGGFGCGATLLVTEHDVYHTESHARDETTTYYDTFCCVECGTETDIGGRWPQKALGQAPSLEERKLRAARWKSRR